MNTDARKPKRIVYIVTGKGCEEFHPRIHKLLSFRPQFNKMVLVARGNSCIDRENMVIKPIPNPTGILRLLGLSKFKHKIDKYLFFPSNNILFVKRVEKKLAQQIAKDLSKGREVCLLTSVPPHDLCQIGLSLKNKFPTIRWIVDWRDFWSYDENYFLPVPKLYRQRLIRLEKKILAKSDLNITTNKYAQRVLETHYKVPSGRAIYINQHFCTEDLVTSSELYGTKKASFSSETYAEIDVRQAIKIGFLGQLFKPPRVPGLKLVKIIRDLRKTGLNIELHVFGKVSDQVKQTLKMYNNHGLVVHENMPDLQSLHNVAHCDYLLLLLDDLTNSKAVMCLKLPQYLSIDKPILGIVPNPSAMADIILETGTGYVIPVDSDWSRALQGILSGAQNSSKTPIPNREAINAFSWEKISKQWFEVLCNT